MLEASASSSALGKGDELPKQAAPYTTRARVFVDIVAAGAIAGAGLVGLSWSGDAL